MLTSTDHVKLTAVHQRIDAALVELTGAIDALAAMRDRQEMVKGLIDSRELAARVGSEVAEVLGLQGGDAQGDTFSTP